MTPEEVAVHLLNHGETLKRIETKVDKKADADTVARVETKVDKTNGRVSGLEIWKARIQGAWFVMSLCGPVITGLIIKFA